MHRLTSGAFLGIPLTNAFERDRLLPGLVDAERAVICLRDLAERGRPTGLLAARPETTPHTLAAIRRRERRRLALALDGSIHRLAAVLLASEPAGPAPPGTEAAGQESPHPIQAQTPEAQSACTSSASNRERCAAPSPSAAPRSSPGSFTRPPAAGQGDPLLFCKGRFGPFSD
ncbi:hypothetical protein [Streptomyces sp. NPDC051577]|uniref:hypothetical protein n=1 Tax=Streptomyces sp. NPDC051577 TaxID=3155166 RepID=UPI00342E7E01